MGNLGGAQRRLPIIAIALLATLTAIAPVGRAAAPPRQTVIVMTTPSHGAAAQNLVRDAGGRVLRELSVIDGFIATVPRSVVGALAALPSVRSVTPDRPMRLQSQYGQDSGIASAVYTDVVRASKTWGSGDTGGGTTVAVVDTGVDTTGDLAGQVVRSVDFTSDSDNLDHYGHGTFVAGLIAGSGAHSAGAIMGVAPGTKLVSLKISGADGATDVTLVLEALEWVKDFASTYNIRVLNLSLGFASQQSYGVDPLDYAVEQLWHSGVVVVTAAGNGGSTGPILAPGNDPFVVTVGASNDRTTVTNTDDKLASFSSIGPTADGLDKPDLLAPGRSVVSSRSPGSTVDVNNPTSEIGDSYMKGSGTSFSTAIVSGVAALVLARSPWLTPDQVKMRLVSTARSLPGGTAPGTGAGVVDAFGATMSTSTASANLSATPAVGGGSLQATRGPACLRYLTGECMTDADANAALGYDPTAVSSDWSGSQWVGSQWVGSQWVGSQWVGSQWVGSQWVGSQWVMAAAS
ncbi:MAG TPA: S8 family peptidase [Mycobacteriales bacterium]|jgi:serine protease AprX|nr:S8 family peptidase [Mycobacteriales bacterium]